MGSAEGGGRIHLPRLGVNVDHVATLRQQRGTAYPDPVTAATLAELGGAQQITVHLREDRRHIQERDVRILRELVQTPLNLEMASTREMVAFATELLPDTVTLVPERREERTTEGGLDVLTEEIAISGVVSELADADITVSLFIDPDVEQIEAARRSGARVVELHTGDYAEAAGHARLAHELERLRVAAGAAQEQGLEVAAGHGLHYRNVADVVRIPEVAELNIGHAIVSRAVLVGMERAVAEMIEAIAQSLNQAPTSW
jgi:pyridoxine 5-phosphate synthase